MKLGVLMLDTRFPRPRGDIGNPASFECGTNFGPYRQALSRRTRRPVLGIVEALGIMAFQLPIQRSFQCFE